MAPILRTLTLGVGAVALAVGAYWTLLFLVQRFVLFPRPFFAGVPPRPPDVLPVWLLLSSGRSEAWFLPADPATPGPHPVLIFAHGNAELIDYWASEFTVPRRWGVSVLLVEYPGYGRSAGRPSQVSITEAIVAAYDWVIAQPGIDTRRLMAYGRSVGGGAACALAVKREVAALILESTFTSVRALARPFGLPGFLVRDPFDNLEAVRAFHRPILIIHGERDEIIPPVHGRQLLAAAPHATFEAVSCGHNDCPRPWPRLGRFLKAQGLLPQGTTE